ncbi:hypothetical protein D6833_11450, partial [Candidatus Parcubacteria bacterium]
MTTLASLAEFAFMDVIVCMAGSAGIRCGHGFPHRFRMAGQTIQVIVSSVERKGRAPVVVEIPQSPIAGIVT